MVGMVERETVFRGGSNPGGARLSVDEPVKGKGGGGGGVDAATTEACPLSCSGPSLPKRNGSKAARSAGNGCAPLSANCIAIEGGMQQLSSPSKI